MQTQSIQSALEIKLNSMACHLKYSRINCPRIEHYRTIEPRLVNLHATLVQMLRSIGVGGAHSAN
jgi:hypothetical protein